MGASGHNKYRVTISESENRIELPYEEDIIYWDDVSTENFLELNGSWNIR